MIKLVLSRSRQPNFLSLLLILSAVLLASCRLNGSSAPPPISAATPTQPQSQTTPPSPTPVLPTPPGTAVSPPATPTAAATAPRQATPTPSASSETATATAPSLPLEPGPMVQIVTTTVTLPTYPFRDYLVEQIDPVYNLPFYTFRRGDYEADLGKPLPTPVPYLAIVLENPYLRLTFLPELGGRLYSAVVKSTGQEIFYHNSVVKPSRYGILEPVEANWWLATGGMEWAYPTQEHGYRWGVPWTYQIEQKTDGATITLSDTAPGRVGVSVAVTLPAEQALFTVRPLLVNDSSEAMPIQFWLNAALSLGAASMSPQTRFIVPTDQVTIHSRGPADWTVPDAHTVLPWPMVGQTDLQVYEQWASYLGLFVPDLDAPFMGAYNPDTDLGVARLITPQQVPGNKLFAFSLSFPDRSYTDDNSQYFEIWGGANIGFWPEDDMMVAPGGQLAWEEQWWPLAGLGGLTWANDRAAIHLAPAAAGQRLTALFPRPIAGQIVIEAGTQTLLAESFAAVPAEPITWQFENATEPVRVTIFDQAGQPLLIYTVPDEDD